MKTKIAITADPHFNAFAEFSRIVKCPITDMTINSRLSDQIVIFWNMAVRSRKHGCQYLVVIGDLFHVRGLIPVEVQQPVYRLFERIRAELGLDIYVSTGNHDQVDLIGKMHGVYSFKHLVNVVDEPLELKLGEVNCTFIPYTSNHEDLLHLFARCNINDPVDLLFAHCGVDGAYVGPIEYKIKDPLTVADIEPERFKWVILGHYHKPQSLGDNILYVGSPAQINRGEAGEKKRWLIYNSSDRSLKSLRTGAKEFIKISTSDALEACHLEGGYYDIVEDDKTSIEDVKKTLDPEVCVKFITKSTAKKQAARLKLTEAMSDEDLLKAYIDHTKASYKLVAVGTKLLADTPSSPGFSLSLKRVRAQNFLALTDVDVKLDHPGSVIALLGLNETSEGFTSNGAGKSSLLPESILWCLYGATVRGLPADKVVNRFEKRECFVTVDFINHEGSEVTVTRYRKSKEFGNNLRVTKDGVDLTQGTPVLTQLKLDDILGVDWDAFTSVIAFSPDTLRFVQATDSERKHVMDSILQTQRFAAAKQLADNGVKNLERELATYAIQITELKTLYERDIELLGNYKESNKHFRGVEAERVSSLQKELASVEKQLQDQEDQYDTACTRLENAKHKLRAVLPDVEKLQNALMEATAAHSEATSTLALQKAHIELMEGKKTEAVNLAGQPCPTCGQKVSNTGSLIVSYNKEIVSTRELVELSERTVLQLAEAKTAAHEKLKFAQTTIKQHHSNKDLATAIERTKNTIKSQIASLKRDKARIQESILDMPANPFPKMISDLEAALEKSLQQRTDLEHVQEKKAALQQKLMYWQKGFGSQGIPLFLLEQMMPMLTEYANDLAYKLTGGSLRIEFTTYSEHTMTDKFKIHAYNEDGSDIYVGNSSGEKRRIDLCVMLALFQLAYSRTKLNILLLDEALDTLDVGGLDSVVELLNSFAKELDLTVYVTSHTDISARLFESITVHKKERRSTCHAE